MATKKTKKSATDDGPTVQHAVRLPHDLLARIEAYRDRVEADVPGVRIGTAGAIRALVEHGLRAVERKGGK